MGLIELMVGLTLITVGILGLNSLAVSMLRGNLSSQLNDEATRLAQVRLEAVRLTGYEATPPGATAEILLDVERPGSRIPFGRETRVEAGALPNTRTITVTMSWHDHVLRQTSFTTEIAR